jgi:hypothetical protein
MFDCVFAWSWTGHGELTTLGVALAISQFVMVAKSTMLAKLHRFSVVKRNIRDGYADEKLIKDELARLEKHPPSSVEQDLVFLFDMLPSSVQEEDLHLGNIPRIGDHLETDSQVRHYMRSNSTVTPKIAHLKAKNYIGVNLEHAWTFMHEAVQEEEVWYDFIYNRGLRKFNQGIAALAKALHTVEDSYAPGHVKRDPASGIIEDVHIWDDENKKPNVASGWPGHEALDNPATGQSGPFYRMAKDTVAAVILGLLGNLQNERIESANSMINLLNQKFATRL